MEEVLDQQQTQEQVHDLLPEMPQTNLQLEANKPKQPEISTPNAENCITWTATSPGS